jgi:hypothetical protein
MKKLWLVMVVMGALAVAGVALGQGLYTSSGIAAQTKQAITKRLAFTGATSYKVASARCQQEGPVNFFCIVRLSNYGQMLATPVYYGVSINASGYIRWTMQR